MRHHRRHRWSRALRAARVLRMKADVLGAILNGITLGGVAYLLLMVFA
jgi:hypothetical protein